MHKITVRRRDKDYMAYKDGDTRDWEAAVTPTYAVRKLVVRFPELQSENTIIQREQHGTTR